MKKLILLLGLLSPFYTQAQHSHYNFPDTRVMYLSQPPTQNLPINTDYWYYQDSKSLFYNGVALTGMAGLSLYFNTLGEGPYVPFAVIYSTAAVGKFIHAGVLRRKERGYHR